MEKEKFDKKKYDNEYIKKNKDRLNFVMPKGRKEQIKRCAELAGISASEWINQAITEKMERQGFGISCIENEAISEKLEKE